MAKNNLGVLQTKQLAILFGAVIVVGLVAGVIGSSVGNALTGKVTLTNNVAGTGTYRIRPEGTYADTWLPYSDGNVYLTSNGAKSGAGFVLRKWLSGSSYSNLMTIDKNGNMVVKGNLTVDNVYRSDYQVSGFCKLVYSYRGGGSSPSYTCNDICTYDNEFKCFGLFFKGGYLSNCQTSVSSTGAYASSYCLCCKEPD
ncbi:MAG TPA: hypothetical protein P5277_03950 [Candidatus Paceibacterota bacterium]|nr:hypothetical protein [Candidatus Paceibacterota bacterium]